jgi:phosphoribosyl 1,2-cyclic phosphodiesterase
MPSKLKSKVSSIVERLKSGDIERGEARERFLSALPDYLFSTIGGNTSCVEVSTHDGNRLIFDAGTGIRELGAAIGASRKPVRCHLFFSHFHWDHIQGLPFFGPAFDPRNELSFYSPRADFRSILEGQMREPYFPITMDEMRARKEFIVLDGKPRRIGDATISYRPMNHPGGCHSYRVESGGAKIVYSTDTELGAADFAKTSANDAYFRDLDALIIDAQYTLGEAIEKYNWGHSSFSMAADFAATWGIRRIVLFHHEPSYSDRKIEVMLKNAAWYVEHLEGRGIEVVLAREGLELEVDA